MTAKTGIILLFMATVEAFVIEDNFLNNSSIGVKASALDNRILDSDTNPSKAFDGVYSECFLHLSYACIQEKTLLYLKELNKLSEVSIIGEYVKFVKINHTQEENDSDDKMDTITNDSEELSIFIDRAIDKFFNNHVLKFKALGKDVVMPSQDTFVGRKRKGGGGGGGGGHGGGDDGGKKKMMMMAMMCMKMKLMMMVPAMMGMMGMMSFKGMMFSMMSFMVSKMMLLMKILEKKGGGGGGMGDGGWAAGGGGGGGGAWMPAGGQDYGGGGGGGGGYDANGQWQSRSIVDFDETPMTDLQSAPTNEREPIISYVPPNVRYSYNEKKPFSIVKKLNDEVIKARQGIIKRRKKRGIIDLLQNSYLYLTNQLLGLRRNLRVYPKYPNYKIVNGIRYVYFPYKQFKKVPKELIIPTVAPVTEETPIITAEDFNKGEILDGGFESRSTKTIKKLQKMKNDIESVVEEDPWE